MYHPLLLDICLTISIYINIYIIYIIYIYTHNVVDLMECFALMSNKKIKLEKIAYQGCNKIAALQS